MERAEARRLLTEQISYLTSVLMTETDGTRYSAKELDQISDRIEALRRDLEGL